jgi:hypothetical protein
VSLAGEPEVVIQTAPNPNPTRHPTYRRELLTV